MPTGGLYYGKMGFFYKASYSSGTTFTPNIGLITGKPADIKTPYIPGSGVGASSFSRRRLLIKRATTCNPKVTCNAAINNLDPYQFFMVRYKGI